MDLRELEAYRLEDAVKFHNELNPRLWQAEKLRPEVRKALLRIADDFRQSLGLRELNVKDITISGSNAAYTYTPHSDIDLHLVVDMPRDDEIYRELFDAKKYQYNDENDFKIGGADIELYVQDAAKPHASQGIYSVRDDRWVRVPSRRRPTIDDSAVENKYMDLARRIDQAIDRGDAYRMRRLWNKIKDMRKAGLAKTGEFGVENLVFKVLRNNGTIERLMKAQQEIKNREMSLAERRRGRRKKQRSRFGYFGGMWYPGYSYGIGSSEASSSDGGGGGDGGGESINEANVVSMQARRTPLVVFGHPFDWNVYDLRSHKMVASVIGGDRSDSKLYEIRIKSSGMTDETRMPPTYLLTAGPNDNPPYKAYELVVPTERDKIEKSPGPGGTTKLRPDEDDVLRHFFKIMGSGRYYGYDVMLVEEGLNQWDLIEKALGAKIMEIDDAMELGYTDVDPEDSSGIVLTSTATNVTESKESGSDLEQVLHGFIKACAEYLHMTEMPRVVLIRDPAWTRENGTFGRYNTDTNTLELAINHRHPLDIIRTMAHEMTHARQNEVTDMPADAGRTGSPYEDEANAMAGRFMRHVAEHHPELFHELPMDEDYDPNGPPPGPEFKPTMPKGTVRVDVSDVYDWYKLGQHISNMKGLGKHDFGKGPPSTILSFGDEDLEHQYIQALKKTGLDTTDIDPKAHDIKKGQKTDPTYNVNEQASGGIPAWRIRFQRFRGKPSFMPEREGKVYLMPMDNSALRTFGNLTGKDDVKIRNMPTEAYLVSGDAMVGDMSIINAISQEARGNNDPKRIDDLKRLYLNYRVPYSQYRPGMFKYPEILATPDQLLQKLDQSVSYDKNSGEIVFKDRTREDVYEASGYIPVNDEEARDPRYSMAITQDIRPGETQRQAAKMGWKTDPAGRPPLLMPRVSDKKSSTAKNAPDLKLVLAEQLRTEFQAYSTDVVESIEQPQALLEVDMSPGALRSWANSDEAKDIVAGFEAELIFRYAQTADNDDWDGDGSEPYPDYDEDPRARSIDNVIEFFSQDNDYVGNSRTTLERVRARLFEEFLEWADSKLEDRWDGEKDEVIRDYMENNVWTPEKKRRIESALEDITDKDPQEVMGSETEEDRALVQRARDQARAEFEAEVEEEIDNDSGYTHDDAHQAWLDNERANFEESDWFRTEYPRMSDVHQAMDLEWPIWVTPEPEARGGRSPEDIAQDLDSVVPVGKVVVSTGYHSATRTADRWIMEPDSSISPEDREDAGWEVVSPPMPLSTALTALRDVIEWARGSGDAYTNRSTGLHMGVSVPSQENVDYVKLILFMGDKHVLEQFERLSSTYCGSAMDRIQTNVKKSVDRLQVDPSADRSGIMDIPWAMELMRQGMLEIAGKTVKMNVGIDKYTSAHIKNGYIEFRSPGGNYLDQDINTLTNTMLRFARALSIASDPTAYREEYAKKLYKVISPQGNDALKLFAAFSTGLLDKKALKQEWNKIQALRVIRKPRAGSEIVWSVVNDWGAAPQRIILRAASADQAIDRAMEYSAENNLGWRRTELRAAPQRVVSTTPKPQSPDLPAEPTNTAQALDNRADSQQVQRTVQAPQTRSDRETFELPQWRVNSHAERTQAQPTSVLVRAANAQEALAYAREILGPRFDNIPNEQFTIAPVVRAQGDQG